MDSQDDYDYGGSAPFLVEFENPYPDRPFIEEGALNYGKLWRFADCVHSWTLGVSRFQNYVHLLHREDESATFLSLRIDEKVSIIETFPPDYIGITLSKVTENDAEKGHIYTILVKIGEDCGAQFDVHGLLKKLNGSALEELRPELEKIYVPWVKTGAAGVYRRIASIYRTLLHWAETMPKNAPVRSKVKRKLASASTKGISTSGTQGSQNLNNSVSIVPAQHRKRNVDGPRSSEQAPKRRKSTGGGGSSGSGLTQVERSKGKKLEAVPEYEKFAKLQSDFWGECKDCYIFGQQSYSVDISQCILAKDEYIIRCLQREIVESVKAQLVQIGDERQRQKVCLTPVDEDGNLLKTKPSSWTEIKDGKFMVINGQHSITASAELQLGGCGEARRKELASWDAFIVWTLDAHKLTQISKFYNSANHLEHVQPTWGWQLISGRRIWTVLGRPTDKENDNERRKNGAVVNFTAYAVSFTLIT